MRRGGAGRVEVLLDNGVSVILGHSASATVVPGQRVEAGQQVATMGGMNGSHVHLETRIWDGTTYQIVDPSAALGGDFVSTAGYPGGFPSAGSGVSVRSYDPFDPNNPNGLYDPTRPIQFGHVDIYGNDADELWAVLTGEGAKYGYTPR